MAGAERPVPQEVARPNIAEAVRLKVDSFFVGADMDRADGSVQNVGPFRVQVFSQQGPVEFGPGKKAIASVQGFRTAERTTHDYLSGDPQTAAHTLFGVINERPAKVGVYTDYTGEETVTVSLTSHDGPVEKVLGRDRLSESETSAIAEVFDINLPKSPLMA